MAKKDDKNRNRTEAFVESPIAKRWQDQKKEEKTNIHKTYRKITHESKTLLRLVRTEVT